jgi:3-methyl-2-oxobutanoate hydroxymethyltransferase
MSPALAALKCSRGLWANSARSTSLDAVRPLLVAQLLRTHGRFSSHSPMGSSAPSRKKVTLNSLQSLYRAGEPITMITAHDFPSGHVGDSAGMEMILVGDSLAMVALGMEDTSEVLVEEMLLHCRSVARAAKSAFTVSIFILILPPSPNPS